MHKIKDLWILIIGTLISVGGTIFSSYHQWVKFDIAIIFGLLVELIIISVVIYMKVLEAVSPDYLNVDNYFYCPKIVKDKIQEIIKYLESIIDQKHNDFFVTTCLKEVELFVGKLKELSSGKLEILDDNRITTLVLNNSKKSIKAISKVSNSFWDSEIGQKYILNNIEAAKRKIKIERIFIKTNEQDLNSLQKIMNQMSSHNIEVKYIDSSNRNSEAFVIMDDKMIWLPEYDKSMNFSKHTILIDKSQISKYMDLFQNISHDAKKYEDTNIDNKQK